MNRNWLRGAALSAAVACAALVASCGGGDVVNALNPTRVITFGDGFGDVGQTGSVYSVNDGTVNQWTQRIASNYGRTIVAANSGGLGYAQGNARIDSTVDAAGGSVPSVSAQIDTFLAGHTFTSTDLVIVSGGVSEIIGLYNNSPATLDADAKAAGTRQAALVRRLVAAGAKYVTVAGVYNMGETPWGAATGQAALLNAASADFNTALLIGLVDLGANVLYLDAAYYVHLVHFAVTDQGGGYGVGNVTGISCTSVDPTNGLGIGVNEVNSRLCTPATLDGAVAYGTSMFADKINLNPVLQVQFGDQSITKIRDRF